MIGPLYNSVADVPPRGFGGGLPGNAAGYYAIRDTNLFELLAAGVYPSQDAIAGKRIDYRAKEGYVELLEGDVFVTTGAGGGGLGDPLLREAGLVAEDVRAGYTTLEHARSAYGVVLDAEGAVSWADTDDIRALLRAQRLGATPDRVP